MRTHDVARHSDWHRSAGPRARPLGTPLNASHSHGVAPPWDRADLYVREKPCQVGAPEPSWCTCRILLHQHNGNATEEGMKLTEGLLALGAVCEHTAAHNRDRKRN